jgi:adenosylcobinamide-GDP ribazoletransferase
MAVFDFVTDLARSLGFLSRLPVPARFFEGDDGRMERTPGGFALAGLVIGVLPALLLFFAGRAETALLGAALAVGLTVALTGALHEDGLGDTADGLGGGRDRERALEIMKDSRIGSYGALALMLSLLVRVGALSALVLMDGAGAAALALLASACLSRAAMVWHWHALPPARPDGVAARVGQPARAALIAAAGSGLVLFLVLLLPVMSLPRVVLTVLAALLAGHVFTLRIKARLGGHTGDTIGAMQQVTDMALLASLALTV